MKIRSLYGFLLASLISACAPVNILNSVVPTAGYRVYKDLAYGQHPRQSLDLYVPEKLAPDAPVIVFFYGGSWQFGNKKDYLFVGQSFAALGYVVAIADYRIYPEVKYPAFLYDSAQAVAFVYRHAAAYGGNAENMYLVGHSAGAYNAVSLAMNPAYLEHAGGKTGLLRGVVGLAGPYDFLPFTDPKIIDIFSTEAEQKKTQPIYYARARLPRMLLLTGGEDDTVSPQNSLHLHDKLKRFGNDVTLKEYEGMGHYGIAAGLATPLFWNTQVRDDIAAFVEKP